MLLKETGLLDVHGTVRCMCKLYAVVQCFQLVVRLVELPVFQINNLHLSHSVH